MCGICGIVSFESPIDIEVVKRMNDALSHRGPDGFGYSHFSNCSLGHRRLSITDLASEHQPITDRREKPSYAIVCDGEIYNCREIEDQLKQIGYSFGTTSDAEAVLASYMAYGPKCLGILNGMFAIAIWNEREKELFLARDRFGQKPLYYAFTERGDFLFASEIKAILASGLIRGNLDYGAVDNYLSLLYVPPYRTIFENIHVLEPASFLIYNEKGVEKKEKYWTPCFEKIKIKEEEACEVLRSLLKDAVKRRLGNGVSTGSFLSGGIDSTIVSFLVTETGEERIKTFSGGFGDYISELPYARQAADLCASDHHEMEVEVEDVPQLLLEMAECYDEPFADSANIPTFLISKYAKQNNVKVVFTGDGPDQMIAHASYVQLDRIVQENFCKSCWRPRTFKKWWELPVFRKWWEFLALTKRLKNQYYFSYAGRRFFSEEEKQKLWGTNRFINDEYVDHYLPDEGVRGVDEALFFDLHCYLPGDVLTKVDRAAMWASLQTRAPFLDPELVDFALSLPCSYRVRSGSEKYILKKAFQGVIPDSILYKRKQGFGAPVDHWLRQPALSDMTTRYLKNPAAKIGNLFYMKSVARLTDEFFVGNNEEGSRWELWRSAYKLWTLLVLEMWLEQWSPYIDFVDG
jgi:asparagine synthase (glutamine-hydrolysing)